MRFGDDPQEITSGHPLRVEVAGELKPTAMEFWHFDAATRTRRGTLGEYYSVDGYELRKRLRAAIGSSQQIFS